nr:hypothetical protein [Tanacetum cinerariifolium]
MGRCRDEIAFGTDAPYLGPKRDRVVADLSQPEKDRLRADIHLDKEKLLFLASGQTNTFDDDVDEGQVQDMAQNEDNIFQADQCDIFDSDVDEAPTAQTIFMANLSSVAPVYDEARPSYDSYTLYEVQNHDNCLDNMNESREEHEMQNDVQPNDGVDSDTEYTSNSNLISYEQVEIGYKNPFYLYKAKQVQPTLYSGQEIVKPNYARVLVYDSEDNLKIAETTRKQMIEKLKDTECVKKKIKIAPRDYLKENYLATFIPQKQLTPEQIFWFDDFITMKAKALKEKAKSAKPITAMIVYPPNTPVKLVPKALPTKFRFSDMHDAYTVAQKHITELEDENSNLKNKIQNDDHDEMIKDFSKLEVEHLNLQLKYQHLKERFRNKKLATSSNAPTFDSVFVIGQLEERLQGKGNMIRELKEKMSRLTKKINEAHPILEFKALDSEKNIQLNDREVHLDYLKHLKESVSTLHEIVKAAGVEKPLDISLVSACRVKGATFASGSKPRSNTKKDKTLPTKSAMKKVEDYPRNNNSSVKRKNRIDSSIIYKRTVMHAYYAKESPILATILPPSLVLSLSPMFDSQHFFLPDKISPSKDAETPVESPIPISPSSSVGSTSPIRSNTSPPDYPFNESLNFID